MALRAIRPDLSNVDELLFIWTFNRTCGRTLRFFRCRLARLDNLDPPPYQKADEDHRDLKGQSVTCVHWKSHSDDVLRSRELLSLTLIAIFLLNFFG